MAIFVKNFCFANNILYSKHVRANQINITENYFLNNIQIRVPTKIPTADAIKIGTTN